MVYISSLDRDGTFSFSLTGATISILTHQQIATRVTKAASTRNKISRSKQSMLHCTGRTRFSVIEHEETINNNGVVPSRVRMFEKTQTRKDKKLVDVVAEEKMAQITDLVSQCEHGTIEISDDEICLKVFGPERPGHVRMWGSTVACHSLYRNPIYMKEIEKYKKQANDARARVEQAEKVAADARARAEQADHKAEKAHTYIRELFNVIKSSRIIDGMNIDNPNDEVLE